MKKINHLIVFSILILFVFGCSQTSSNDAAIQAELKLKTDNTITIDIASSSIDECPISELIDSVRYVALENSDSALIGVVKNVKVAKDLIYVLDLQNDHLKCFDRNGKFLRNACQRGGGPKEIAHLIDFDVDEDFLYILDGAKVAIHFYDHEGNYIKKQQLPFRAQKMKRLSNSNYLFELSPFELNNENNSNMVIYSDHEFKPIKYYLNYIEGAFSGVAFENKWNSTYFSSQYGNGIYERTDSLLFMKYYLDFGGKYFNRDKQKDGFKEAIEQGVYFTSSAPLHNNEYLLHAYSAGLKREAVLLINLSDNKSLFVKKLIQDREDLIDFTFSHTLGYDQLNKEFFGICNYIDLSDITDNKESTVKKLKQLMPKEVQTFVLQDNGDKKVNQILLFYTLKSKIHLKL